jgi:hypothetical protein
MLSLWPGLTTYWTKTDELKDFALSEFIGIGRDAIVELHTSF